MPLREESWYISRHDPCSMLITCGAKKYLPSFYLSLTLALDPRFDERTPIFNGTSNFLAIDLAT